VILTAFTIPYLPDVVPTHYNGHHLADAFGPKSSVWFIGGIYSGVGLFFFILSFGILKLMNWNVKKQHPSQPTTSLEGSQENASADKKEENASADQKAETDSELEEKKRLEALMRNEKIFLYTNISFIIMMLTYSELTAFFLYTAYYDIRDLRQAFQYIDLEQLSLIGSGVFIVILALTMTHIPRNKYVGLCKTKWSYKNDVTWHKSQKFAGKCFSIIGLLLTLSSLFVSTEISTFITLILILAGIAATFYYSYKIAQKY
jgi:uncharacterized membrane protein